MVGGLGGGGAREPASISDISILREQDLALLYGALACTGITAGRGHAHLGWKRRDTVGERNPLMDVTLASEDDPLSRGVLPVKRILARVGATGVQELVCEPRDGASTPSVAADEDG